LKDRNFIDKKYNWTDTEGPSLKTTSIEAGVSRTKTANSWQETQWELREYAPKKK
jgi:hypothetical protein